MVNTSARLDDCAYISQLVVYHMFIRNHSNNCYNIYLVTPEMVTEPTSYRKDTVTIHTVWKDSQDTGLCVVQYELWFLDDKNNTVYKEDKIANKEYIKNFDSTSQRDSVESIKVRATFSGQSGNWSETEKVSFTTPAPTTTIAPTTEAGKI